jgi:hypothetical protein
MRTETQAIVMKGEPITGSQRAKHAAITCMLLISVHEELFEGKASEENYILSGKSFDIIFFGEGEEQIRDRVIFIDEFFETGGFNLFGAMRSPYFVKEEDGKIFFEAEHTSYETGAQAWKGVVEEKKISGTMVWARIGFPTLTYNFEGWQEPEV